MITLLVSYVLYKTMTKSPVPEAYQNAMSFQDFLNKTKRVIQKRIIKGESKKVDVLDISMYSNLSSTKTKLFKRYINDFNTLINELGDFSKVWLSLHEELNSSDWVEND